MRKRFDFKRFGRQVLIFLVILVLGLLNHLKAQSIYSKNLPPAMATFMKNIRSTNILVDVQPEAMIFVK